MLQRHWISATLALQSKILYLRAGVAHVERVHVYFPRINFERALLHASTVTQLSKLWGETLTSIWYFRNIFMHQYSLKSYWQPWVCSWTRYTSRFSGPLSWVYTHQERLFRRKVSFRSYRMLRLLHEKEQIQMDFWLWTLWCLKEVLDHRDIVWPKGCYQMITAF